MTAMTGHFGNALPEMLIEPGRAVIGRRRSVAAEVVLVSRRDKDGPVRWVYLDIGRFGGLAETEGEAIKYRITTPHDDTAMGPVVIAGPTCDGVDILYEKSNFRLPLAFAPASGWRCCRPVPTPPRMPARGFNGFAPLAEHYL